MEKIRVKKGAILMLIAMIASEGSLLLGLYFMSAALHECGHLLAARALKIGIKEVRFDFSGVRICIEDKITSYRSELILAAAGPFVNAMSVAVSLLFFSHCNLSYSEIAEALMRFCDGEISYPGAWGFFAAASLMQGGINLLPVNTLDGGRIVFCVAAMIFGERCASAVLNVTSFAVAFTLWTVALYLLLRVSAGLGVFVFAVCVFASTVQNKEKSAILS